MVKWPQKLLPDPHPPALHPLNIGKTLLRGNALTSWCIPPDSYPFCKCFIVKEYEKGGWCWIPKCSWIALLNSRHNCLTGISLKLCDTVLYYPRRSSVTTKTLLDLLSVLGFFTILHKLKCTKDSNTDSTSR